MKYAIITIALIILYHAYSLTRNRSTKYGEPYNDDWRDDEWFGQRN